MAGVKRRSMAELCLALGLFILAGVFRQLDRADSRRCPPPLFFLLTNLIYIGLAMAWGFSISHRILHRSGAAISAAGLRDGGAVAVSARGEDTASSRLRYD